MKVLAAFLFLVPLVCAAQDDSAASSAPPCSSAEYRQFDFWVGEWEVT